MHVLMLFVVCMRAPIDISYPRNAHPCNALCMHFSTAAWTAPCEGSAAVSWPKSARDENYMSGRIIYFGVSSVMSSLWFLQRRSALYPCRCRCTLHSCTPRISFQQINFVNCAHQVVSRRQFQTLLMDGCELNRRFVLWISHVRLTEV